jgi:hypothetical protein
MNLSSNSTAARTFTPGELVFAFRTCASVSIDFAASARSFVPISPTTSSDSARRSAESRAWNAGSRSHSEIVCRSTPAFFAASEYDFAVKSA